jgi:hypothetical protein
LCKRRSAHADARPSRRLEKILQRGWAHGSGEQEPLAIAATELSESLPLLGSLDSFGDAIQVQDTRHIDDRRREFAVFVVAVDAVDEVTPSVRSASSRSIARSTSPLSRLSVISSTRQLSRAAHAPSALAVSS